MNFRSILTFIICIATFTFCNAQKIEINKNRFTQNGNTLKMKTLVNAVSSNTEAYQILKSAKSRYDGGNVLGAVGGLLIGYPLGTAIRGDDANWGMLGIGAVIAGISIPISTGAINQAKQAVHIYNKNLTNSYKEKPAYWTFKSKNNGIGLSFNF